MSETVSPSAERTYGLARVCRVWQVARSSIYHQRNLPADRQRRRPGPVGAASDADLVSEIRAVLEAAPFHGEGYRKVWARLRQRGVRTAERRVQRLMREHDLSAPNRPPQRPANDHDGTITTDRVDETWGTDMAQAILACGARVHVFAAVDHCNSECIGLHAAFGANRWEALEPVRQGVGRHFGPAGADIAAGLMLRHDHGSNYMAHDLRACGARAPCPSARSPSSELRLRRRSSASWSTTSTRASCARSARAGRRSCSGGWRPFLHPR